MTYYDGLYTSQGSQPLVSPSSPHKYTLIHSICKTQLKSQRTHKNEEKYWHLLICRYLFNINVLCVDHLGLQTCSDSWSLKGEVFFTGRGGVSYLCTLRACVDDVHKLWLQRGSAYQEAIHVSLGRQLPAVSCCDWTWSINEEKEAVVRLSELLEAFQWCKTLQRSEKKHHSWKKYNESVKIRCFLSIFITDLHKWCAQSRPHRQRHLPWATPSASHGPPGPKNKTKHRVNI